MIALAPDAHAMTRTVDIETVATHEAGHAVMRFVQGLPVTELTVDDVAGGLCAGTGRPQPVQALVLVTLAGFVAETGYGFDGGTLDLANSQSDDLDKVRGMLRHATHLRIVADASGTPSVDAIDATVLRYWERACEELWPYSELVEAIAERLVEARRLSARSVAALCREFRKRARSAAIATH